MELGYYRGVDRTLHFTQPLEDGDVSAQQDADPLVCFRNILISLLQIFIAFVYHVLMSDLHRRMSAMLESWRLRLHRWASR